MSLVLLATRYVYEQSLQPIHLGVFSVPMLRKITQKCPIVPWVLTLLARLSLQSYLLSSLRVYPLEIGLSYLDTALFLRLFCLTTHSPGMLLLCLY